MRLHGVTGNAADNIALTAGSNTVLQNYVDQQVFDGELATAMVAGEIYDSSTRTAQVLKRIELMRDLRATIQNDVDRLNAIEITMRYMIEDEEDDDVHSLEEFASRFHVFVAHNPDIMADYPALADAASRGSSSDLLEVLPNTLFARFDYHIRDGRVVKTAAGTYFNPRGFDANQIQKANEELRGKMDQIDSKISTLTTQLQSMIQQKQRYVTLFTNIDQATSEAAQYVSENTR